MVYVAHFLNHQVTKYWSFLENEVKHCTVREITLGDGPFPTILDMSGAGGGINEHKGATLSSEGFCVFSLAFFQYKTLISDLNDLDLDYFKVCSSFVL